MLELLRFITNFSNKKSISSQQLKNIIDNNLSRIKKDFPQGLNLGIHQN